MKISTLPTKNGKEYFYSLRSLNIYPDYVKGGNIMGKLWKIVLLVIICTTSFLALAATDPKWIWFPDPPGVKGESRYFRTLIEIDEIPESALARIVATQKTTVYVNGEEIGYIRADEILGSFELADYLKIGKNVLGVKIEADVDKEIQPLFINVLDLDDKSLLVTDKNWKAAPIEIDGWLEINFNDENWAEVIVSEDRVKPEIPAMELVAMMKDFAPEKDPELLEKASVWATHSAEYVFTDDLPVKGQDVIRGLTGRNQYASAQLAIRSEEDILALEIEFSDLLQKDGDAVLDRSRFYYNFIDTWYMPKNSTETPQSLLVKQAPAPMPDILSENIIANIPKDYTKAVFLRFYVPEQTPAGIYEGHLTLKTVGATRDVPIEIEVLPIDLPDETNIKVTIWFQPDYIVQYNDVIKYSDEFWSILEYYAKVMAEHRQNMVWTPLGLVDLVYDEDGVLQGDFSKFDRWIEIFFNEGFKYIELSHIGGRIGDWTSPFAYWQRSAYNPQTKSSQVVPLADYVHVVQEHLREKDWLDVAYIHVADEPVPGNYPSWIALAEEVKKGAPDLKIMEALHYTQLSDYLDVAIPQLDYFDQNRRRLMQEQEEGKIELWFYTCWLPQGNYPNRLLDYPLYKTRILHWANFIYDAHGYLHWGYNWWRAFEVGYAPGDGWIVYPTKDNMIPSIRYEAMREGLEDFEYFLMHANKTQEIAKELGAPLKGDERAKEIAKRVMPALTRYTDDPLELLQARERLLREIVELDKGPKALVITEVTEDKVLRYDTETEVEIYAEKEAKVYLNGVLLNEISDGYFKATAYITPDNNRITVTVVKDDKTKTIERIYTNWRIIN